MRIFVFGNINSGKTSVCSLLLKVFRDYRIYSIDDFRKQYGKGDFESDVLAQDNFVNAVAELNQEIVECTGLGPLGRKLSAACHQKGDLIIHVKTPLAICHERIKLKDFSEIPYPPFEETLENTIIRCHNEFENGDLTDLWRDRVLEIIEIDGSEVKLSDIEALPVRMFSYLDEIVRFSHSNQDIRALILIGSLAIGELTEYSDIDLFILSKLSTDQIKQLLKETLKNPIFFDQIGNKITIRYSDNHLIEIHCVNDIEDMRIFYRESHIKSISRTILKGEKSLVVTLESFTIYRDNHFECFVF